MYCKNAKVVSVLPECVNLSHSSNSYSELFPPFKIWGIALCVIRLEYGWSRLKAHIHVLLCVGLSADFCHFWYTLLRSLMSPIRCVYSIGSGGGGTGVSPYVACQL